MLVVRSELPSNRIILGVLAVALAFGVLAGLLMPHFTAQAQDDAQTFVVLAGAGVAPNNTEVLAFAPAVLDVHRGDTVAWASAGFHNIRFAEEGLLPLVLVPGVDDVEIPQVNPAIMFPTIESGATLNALGVNSGLPAPPGYSLVIDLEPGSYSYVCDVHPGMAGTINVVDDDTPVASPIDVILQGGGEIGERAGASFGIAEELEAGGTVATAVDGVAHIQADVNGADMRISVQQFFPFTAVINAGESVTWTIPEGSADPHTVTWPPLRGQDFAPIEQEGGPPIMAFGPGFTPIVPESVGQGDAFNSSLLFPGQTFTLTFTEPGAYPFVCNIHPAMQGTVVVMPGA